MNMFFDIDALNKAQHPNLAAELELKNFGYIRTVADYANVTERLLYNVVWGTEALSSDEWEKVRECSTRANEGLMSMEYLQGREIVYCDLAKPEWLAYVRELWGKVEKAHSLIINPCDVEAYGLIPTLGEVLAAGRVTVAGARFVRQLIASIERTAQYFESLRVPRDAGNTAGVIEPVMEDTSIPITEIMRMRWRHLVAREMRLLESFYRAQDDARKCVERILEIA